MFYPAKISRLDSADWGKADTFQTASKAYIVVGVFNSAVTDLWIVLKRHSIWKDVVNVLASFRPE